MSVSIADFPLWSDVLTKTEFNPWFEKLSTFNMGALLLSALFIVYDVEFAGDVHCKPSTGNSKNLSTSDVEFVNSVCYNEWGNILHFSDLFVLGAFTLIFLSRAWWVLVPQVIKTFSSARDLDETLRKMDLTPTDIEKSISSPFADLGLDGPGTESARIAIRNARQWLFYRKPGACRPVVPGIYAVRNLTVIVSILISGMVIGFLLIYPASKEAVFACNSTSISEISSAAFVCSYGQSKPLLVHLCFFVACEGLLLFTTVASGFVSGRHSQCICCYCACECGANVGADEEAQKSKGVDHAIADNNFAAYFSRHSRPLASYTVNVLEKTRDEWRQAVVNSMNADGENDDDFRNMHARITAGDRI